MNWISRGYVKYAIEDDSIIFADNLTATKIPEDLLDLSDRYRDDAIYRYAISVALSGCTDLDEDNFTFTFRSLEISMSDEKYEGPEYLKPFFAALREEEMNCGYSPFYSSSFIYSSICLEMLDELMVDA